MKSKKQDFKAVEFMRTARKLLTEKYQQDRVAFLNELQEATNIFLKLRKKKSAHVA